MGSWVVAGARQRRLRSDPAADRRRARARAEPRARSSGAHARAEPAVAAAHGRARRAARQRLPPTPIPERRSEVYSTPSYDFPRERRLPEDRSWSELAGVDLAWADGALWLRARPGSQHVELLLEIVDDPARAGTDAAAVELPSSAALYRDFYERPLNREQL